MDSGSLLPYYASKLADSRENKKEKRE